MIYDVWLIYVIWELVIIGVNLVVDLFVCFE